MPVVPPERLSVNSTAQLEILTSLEWLKWRALCKLWFHQVDTSNTVILLKTKMMNKSAGDGRSPHLPASLDAAAET